MEIRKYFQWNEDKKTTMQTCGMQVKPDLDGNS